MRPSDSLRFFRVAFGLILVWQVGKYLSGDWIERLYSPGFHFQYPGFGWVRPWPAPWMRLHFWGLAVAASLLTFGLFQRAAALAFGLGFGYVLLLDVTRYQNHLYLITLLSLVLAAVEEGPRFSPRWSLGLLRFQVAVPYVFGGLAKLEGEWLSGRAMRIFLDDAAPAALQSDLIARAGALGGALFDLLIVPALLWGPTRRPAFALACAFHLANEWLFDIGVFPWLMLAATTLFLEPDWPRRAPLAYKGPEPRTAPWVAPALALWAAFQLLFPLRHWLYRGDVTWTMEGDRFAWRMMLYERRARAEFYVDGLTVDPAKLLSEREELEMSYDPDLIRRFARHLGDEFTRDGRRPVVRAAAVVSLNGSPPRRIVDPSVDLGAKPR